MLHEKCLEILIIAVINEKSKVSYELDNLDLYIYTDTRQE